MTGIGVERLRKVAELIKQDDMDAIIKFVGMWQNDFLNKKSCAEIDFQYRKNIAVYLEHRHFDKSGLAHKTESVGEARSTRSV